MCWNKVFATHRHHCPQWTLDFFEGLNEPVEEEHEIVPECLIVFVNSHFPLLFSEIW